MKVQLTHPIFVSKVGKKSGFDFLVSTTSTACVTAAERVGIPSIQSLECLFGWITGEDGVPILGRVQGNRTSKSEQREQRPEVVFIPRGALGVSEFLCVRPDQSHPPLGDRL